MVCRKTGVKRQWVGAVIAMKNGNRKWHQSYMLAAMRYEPLRKRYQLDEVEVGNYGDGGGFLPSIGL